MTNKAPNKIDQAALSIRLEQHKLWWDSCAAEGAMLSLPEYDLSHLCFNGAQLSGANLTRCNLDDCDFTDAILQSINVTESSFHRSLLIRTDLKGSDFKYVKFDEFTKWDDAIYEGMMIDTPTADSLPIFMDKNVMQVVQEYSIRFNFLFNEHNADAGRALLDDFETLIQDKYRDNNVKMTKERRKDNVSSKEIVDLKIQVDDIDNLQLIQQDVFNYGRLLRGEISWNRLTDDVVLQNKLALNAQFLEFKIDMQRKQLEAFTGMQQEVKESLSEIANSLAQQFKTNLLPPGPSAAPRADFIVTLPNGNRKTIDTEKIVYIYKADKHYPVIYLNDGTTERIDEIMSNIAGRLAVVRPTLIITHKSFIVNLAYVTRKENDGNVYRIFCKEYPDAGLLVGQNHKKRFNDCIVEHHIALEAEEVKH